MNAAFRLRRLPTTFVPRPPVPRAPLPLRPTPARPFTTGRWGSPAPLPPCRGLSLPGRPRFFHRPAVLCDNPARRPLAERVADLRHDLGTVGLAVVCVGAVLVVVLVLEVVIPTLTRVVPLAVVGLFGGVLLGLSTAFNHAMRGGRRRGQAPPPGPAPGAARAMPPASGTAAAAP
eukprot:EG_transcript_23038